MPVRDFAHSGPDDRHYRLDPVAGEVSFGPEVRHADGELRQYGAVPPLGSRLSMSAYRVGGGRRGNVARGVIRVLKSSVPYVTQVENRHPAAGGVDGETMDNAKLRGPLELRASGRAVTADDFEVLARDVAPDAARVACLPATSDRCGGRRHAALPGAVRLLVVPRVVTDDLGRIAFDDLRTPPRELLRRISDHLDQRRLVGTRLVVEPPFYQGVTVVARVTAGPDARAEAVQDAALRALYAHLSPQDGGADGRGWPFGRAVRAFDISAVLARVPGLAEVDDLLLFPADPASGTARRPGAADRPGAGRARVLLPAPGAGAGMTAPAVRTAPARPSPHPLGATLPALYLDDVFAQNLCASLDEVLAPVIGVLDCFPAYLDPRTAPPDMVDWLASWTGLLAARKLPLARRRRLVARAAALHAWRGTPDAVRELVELACNRPVELEESGGAGWSSNPGTPLPGSDQPGLVVRVRTTGVLDRPADDATEPDDADAPVDEDLLTRLLELVVPAHLPVRVDLVS